MEIKIRVWDREAGEYVYSDKESEYYAWGFEKGKLKCFGLITEYPADPMEAPYPGSYEVEGDIELFTGLKDKNGKEVYQGDILKITADKEGYGETSYGGFAVVESETCGYYLKVFNPTEEELEEQWRKGGDGFDSTSLWHTDDQNNIEIIGNQYEKK